jgi:hypothetical protein
VILCSELPRVRRWIRRARAETAFGWGQAGLLRRLMASVWRARAKNLRRANATDGVPLQAGRLNTPHTRLQQPSLRVVKSPANHLRTHSILPLSYGDKSACSQGSDELSALSGGRRSTGVGRERELIRPLGLVVSIIGTLRQQGCRYRRRAGKFPPRRAAKRSNFSATITRPTAPG